MPKPKKPPPRPIRDLFAEPGPAAYVSVHGRRRRKSSAWSANRQRLAEIVRLIEHRHGGPVDTDGEGETYLWAAAPALIEQAGGFHEKVAAPLVRDWACRVTPNVGQAEIERIITEAGERADRGGMHLSAQEVGDDLRLTLQERDGLKIRTIRPAGMTERQFQELQRNRRAANARAARAAEGARPREKSKARTKPWASLKTPISRATFYRLGLHDPDALASYLLAIKADETNSWLIGTEYLQGETKPSQLPTDRTRADPARKHGSSQGVGADGHAAGAKTRRLVVGRAEALQLSGGADDKQGDLFDRPSAHAERALALMAATRWSGGSLPPDVRLAVRDALRASGVTHERAGRAIGLTRMAVTNAVRARGVDGLSLAAAENLRRLLQRQAGTGEALRQEKLGNSYRSKAKA
ncbi:hypothetical protein FHR71_002260 [Methylobacterium sp. RAS18]|nr:hypothetical protein [Methylobacterium sp. RAS18]